jgi:hypothetical protein
VVAALEPGWQLHLDRIVAGGAHLQLVAVAGRVHQVDCSARQMLAMDGHAVVHVVLGVVRVRVNGAVAVDRQDHRSIAANPDRAHVALADLALRTVGVALAYLGTRAVQADKSSLAGTAVAAAGVRHIGAIAGRNEANAKDETGSHGSSYVGW